MNTAKTRHRRSARAMLAAAVLTALAASAASPSQAPSQSQTVNDFEQRLGRINGQIKDLKARLEAESRKENSILTSLARININKSIVERELAARNLELERGRADLAVIQENA
ncbi:MAG TPA: hypothetical protein VLN41_01775, partial [Candidatus Bathyarchaeia archaeon]|nr:hypothetical protein [Candidatus Bathyarchaeia archaeon]